MTSGTISTETALWHQANHKDDKINSIRCGVTDGYGRSFGTGSIEIILLIDEDAKIPTSASPCESGKSICDLGVLSAALYGIAAECPERFGCEDFNICLVTRKDRQIFIQSIGVLRLEGEKVTQNPFVEERLLNIDISERKTSWISRIINQAMAKSDDELIHAWFFAFYMMPSEVFT
jgi:hypothetical protein